MDVVCAGAGDDVGRRAQAVAKFGGGVVSQNPKFGDRIYGRFENEAPVHAIEIIRAIDQKVVRLWTLAVDRVRLPLTQ